MAKQKTYFESRMAALAASAEDIVVKYPHYVGEFEKSDIKEWVESPLFTSDDEQNILIHYHNRTGAPAMYTKARQKTKRPYIRTRYKTPLVDTKTGDDIKYKTPAGAGTFPFLPPALIDKYRKREKIQTLVLTEGEFKAFKGSLHGLDIAALTGISHFKNQDTLKLHEDLLRIIVECEVEYVVWLVDGDCCNLTSSYPENEEADLYRRPNLFFKSAMAIKTLLNDHNLKLYFAHPLSSELDGNPKGLDDLYASLVKSDVDPADIGRELTVHSGHYKYFKRFDITSRLDELRRYFCIDKVENFYHRHISVIGEKIFTYHGTKYRFNRDSQECEIIVPGAASKYFRVGVDYYREIEVPNKYSQLDKQLVPWTAGTITSDEGKNFIKHIQKLMSFCIVPDHSNYQRVIHNCYNKYYPFDHQERLKGDFDNIKGFLEHIFGNDEITIKRKGQDNFKCTGLELGLDYIQILYQKPQQILPILCLVSKEKSTGKTTFMKFLKAIFTQNAVFVGNDDLSNDFNSSWASRLLVLCEEVFLDKKPVVEKLKALSTADRIMMNAKGKDQREMEFFAKFVLASNNENNFIYVDDDEIRFWVRKINPITRENDDVNLLEKMIEEIPYFLFSLDRRRIVTENCSRMWFHPELLKTEALKRVVEHSRPTAIKEITGNIREMFMDFDRDKILLTTDRVREVLLGGSKRYENNYLDRLLADEIGVSRLKDAESGKTIVTRYKYPMWVKQPEIGSSPMLVEASDQGRPWVFKREMFLTTEEAESVMIEDVLKRDMQPTNGHNASEPFTDIIETYELPFENRYNEN